MLNSKTGIGCLEGTISLLIKEGSKLDQAPSDMWHMGYNNCSKRTLKTCKKNKKKQIMIPLCVDETSEWYNNFVLVPKQNWKV